MLAVSSGKLFLAYSHTFCDNIMNVILVGLCYYCATLHMRPLLELYIVLVMFIAK